MKWMERSGWNGSLVRQVRLVASSKMRPGVLCRFERGGGSRFSFPFQCVDMNSWPCGCGFAPTRVCCVGLTLDLQCRDLLFASVGVAS